MFFFVMAAGNGLKNLQRSDTKCWGQGRKCGSKSNTLCDEEPTYEKEQDTHRERERDKEYAIFQILNSYKLQQQPLKGYKVTL